MHVDCVATAQLHCFVREGGVRVGLLALIVSAPCVAGCGSLNNVCAHTLCVFLCVCGGGGVHVSTHEVSLPNDASHMVGSSSFLNARSWKCCDWQL